MAAVDSTAVPTIHHPWPRLRWHVWHGIGDVRYGYGRAEVRAMAPSCM